MEVKKQLTYRQQKYLSKTKPWYIHSRVKNVQKKVEKVKKKLTRVQTSHLQTQHHTP